MPITLQQELKRLREKKSLTQQNVADLMGMKRTSYARKEQEGSFNDDEIQQLSQILEADIQVLRTLEPGPPDNGKLVRNYEEYIFQYSLRMEAMVKVMGMYVSELVAAQRKEPSLKVYNEMQDAIASELQRIKRELE